jgi:hypothetical protein
VTDGTSFWVVDGTSLKVFKYTLSGSSLGSWSIDPATMTYAKDQTFSLEAESVEGANKVKAAGTWKVEKGEIVTTVKIGKRNRVTRTKVIAVADSTLKVPASVASVTRPAAVPIPIEELRELVIVFKKVHWYKVGTILKKSPIAAVRLEKLGFR